MVFATRHEFQTDSTLRDFVLQALNTLAEAWQTTGPFIIDGQNDLNFARNWLNLMAEVFNEQERRDWLPGFIDAYLHRVGLTSVGTFEQVPLADLVPQVGDIWSFFAMIRLRPEGLNFIDRFIEPGVSPDIAFQALSQVDLDTAELTPRLAKLVTRLPGGERDVPGSLWMRLAMLYADGKDWANAVAAMKKGFASVQPAVPGPETARILIHQVMKQRPDDPSAAVKTACAELGLSPWIPRWWQWYNEGCRAEAEGEYDFAVACFKVVLRFMDAPQEMDPTLSVEPSNYGSPHLRQNDDLDFSWISDRISRRNSAKFRMALCSLILHKPDQAASLLREVALDVGQDRVSFLYDIHANGNSSNPIHLGVLASTLLHNLHLLNEIQGTDTTGLDQAAIAKQCVKAAHELQGVRLKNEAQYFFDAAERLKSPAGGVQAGKENGFTH